MKRIWPIIAVSDVASSAAWYVRLLDATQSHPGGTVFDQILDEDGVVLLCLHHWGPSGPRGDHIWPSLASSERGKAENGLLLWFVVDDFDAAWSRAQRLGAVVGERPNSDNGTGMCAFVVRDPDGYYVAVNQARS
jgi:catechol 2,3-dioxygenase-like lactoylglutathione lyase family enzyme